MAFLLSMSKGLSQLNFYTLDSVSGLNLLFREISGLSSNCWATYAKIIIVTTQSKKWWNNKYKIALETYR